MPLAFLNSGQLSDRYGAACGELLATIESCELGPGRPVSAAREQLARLDHATLAAGRDVHSSRMADCCLSGLWLAFNYLDESHNLSQEIETPSGSFWHGIMHRREPDYENAKYWFRRVKQHPVYALLAAEVVRWSESSGVADVTSRLTAHGKWDPYALVDLCESAAERQPEWAPICCHVGWLEWQLLFDYCYTQAFSFVNSTTG